MRRMVALQYVVGAALLFIINTSRTRKLVLVDQLSSCQNRAVLLHVKWGRVQHMVPYDVTGTEKCAKPRFNQ
jgi:hypothetical protein